MRVLLILAVFSLIACSSPKKQEVYSLQAVDLSQASSLDESLVLAQQKSLERLENRVTSQSMDSKGESSDQSTVGAKDVQPQYLMSTKDNHPKVKKWIRYYSKKDRKRFQRFLNRGARYKQVIQDLLVSQGLPPDLYYLGILESGYVIKARSHAGAVGPWQFMAPTGREYGLKINNYVDERQDPIRSTMAATRYLKELFRQKKSWYLALAAYNAGPGRVRRAIRRGGVRNYWSLTGRRLLPYDTREYVPQFLAILSIGRNLEKYGFVEEAKEVLAPMELVKVPSPVKLQTIAQKTGVSTQTLKKINPHLRKGMTPPNSKKVYHLWVPKESVEATTLAFESLKSDRVKGLKAQRYVASRRVRYHRVRRGQNLSTIARRYGTTVSQLKRLNGLRRSQIYIGQRLKVRSTHQARRSVASNKKARYHRVRRGQNLSTIARRYGTSVAKLKKLNGLRRSQIYVGQKLKLRGPTKKLKVARKKVRRYKIRRGDNLYKIARKFGLSIRKLKKLNNLKGNRIHRGQYLKVAAY
jgi:membrane-bound lytic murein transglycosylase D